jgi:hypothetical protein
MVGATEMHKANEVAAAIRNKKVVIGGTASGYKIHSMPRQGAFRASGRAVPRQPNVRGQRRPADTACQDAAVD